jgi:hypothetical protein
MHAGARGKRRQQPRAHASFDAEYQWRGKTSSLDVQALVPRGFVSFFASLPGAEGQR